MTQVSASQDDHWFGLQTEFEYQKPFSHVLGSVVSCEVKKQCTLHPKQFFFNFVNLERCTTSVYSFIVNLGRGKSVTYVLLITRVFGCDSGNQPSNKFHVRRQRRNSDQHSPKSTARGHQYSVDTRMGEKENNSSISISPFCHFCSFIYFLQISFFLKKCLDTIVTVPQYSPQP